MRFILCFLLLFGTPAFAETTTETAAATAPGSTERFALCREPENWGTSAGYLQQVARCAFGDSGDANDGLRVAIIEDIYIKSWSYAVLNKGFFWVSIALALLVLCWPSLGAIFKPDPPKDDEEAPPPTRFQRAITSASVQTSVTALAAFSFAFYAHYKEKQTLSESLMRTVLYAEKLEQPLVDRVVERMSEMDKGFGFAGSVKPTEKE